MTRPVTLVVAALLIAIAGCQHKHHQQHANNYASAGKTAADSNTEQAINDLMAQYRQALLKKDAATLERIWADDLIFTNPRGQVVNKSQRLANIKTSETEFKGISETDRQIRVLGPDSAVMTCRVDIEGKYSGQPESGPHRAMVIYTRNSGAWQISEMQLTRIAE